MATTWGIVIVLVLALIVLLIASVFASIAASDSYASSNYAQKDANAQTAHYWATISAVIGWSSVAFLLVVFIAGWLSSAFTFTSLKDIVLDSSSQVNVDKFQTQLANIKAPQIIILVALIILLILNLLLGIFSAIVAYNLSSVKSPDSKIKSAYTAAVVAAVAGIGATALIIVGLVLYFGLRAKFKKEEAKAGELKGKQVPTKAPAPSQAGGKVAPVPSGPAGQDARITDEYNRLLDIVENEKGEKQKEAYEEIQKGKKFSSEQKATAKAFYNPAPASFTSLNKELSSTASNQRAAEILDTIDKYYNAQYNTAYQTYVNNPILERVAPAS